MNLQDMMQAMAAKMRADFEHLSSQFQHKGERGGCREETVSEFLRQHLPQHLDVVSGELCARDGQSCHCDLIVIDRMKVPRLGIGDTRLVPIEGAYAVVEVKSDLDSCEFGKCLRDCDAVKGLPRDAYTEVRSDAELRFNVAGRELRNFPLLYSVFAYTAINPATLAEAAAEHWRRAETPRLIDSVLCLDRWVMCWGRTEEDVTWVEPGWGPRFPDLDLVEAEKNALLTFYLLHYKWLSQATCDPIDMLRYSGVGSFGPTKCLLRAVPVSAPCGEG